MLGPTSVLVGVGVGVEGEAERVGVEEGEVEEVVGGVERLVVGGVLEGAVDPGAVGPGWDVRSSSVVSGSEVDVWTHGPGTITRTVESGCKTQMFVTAKIYMTLVIHQLPAARVHRISVNGGPCSFQRDSVQEQVLLPLTFAYI